LTLYEFTDDDDGV